MKKYWVYIICSQKRGTLYIGVTNDIANRIYQHKQRMADGFSKRYSIHKLVYAEEFNNVNEAIHREKILKKWNRAWKIDLIEKQNPEWIDFYDTLI